jgi:hypothetical protein
MALLALYRTTLEQAILGPYGIHHDVTKLQQECLPRKKLVIPSEPKKPIEADNELVEHQVIR